MDFVEVSPMDCEVIWYVGTIGFDSRRKVDFVEVSPMDCEVVWYVGTIGFDSRRK